MTTGRQIGIALILAYAGAALHGTLASAFSVHSGFGGMLITAVCFTPAFLFISYCLDGELSRKSILQLVGISALAVVSGTIMSADQVRIEIAGHTLRGADLLVTVGVIGGAIVGLYTFVRWLWREASRRR